MRIGDLECRIKGHREHRGHRDFSVKSAQSAVKKYSEEYAKFGTSESPKTGRPRLEQMAQRESPYCKLCMK